MSRRGVRKIDQVVDPISGQAIDIRLDVADSRFEADVFGELWSDKDLGALKTRVLKALQNQAKLTWLDVIEVTTAGSFYRGESLRIDMERYWVAPRAKGIRPLTAGRMVEGADDDDGKRARRSRTLHEWDRDKVFAVPCHGRQGMYWLPYTPEAWAALEAIKADIEKWRLMLDKLLASSDAHERLKAVGRRLIVLPEEDA